MTNNAARDELPPLRGMALLLTALVVSLATGMNVLDITIANVSIPSIAGNIGVSPNQGTWVITSFAVANAISLPLTGWLTQRFGAVRLFVLSILLFALFSLACGLATNLQALVIFRILQGAVAGPAIPLSQALLLQSFPRAKAGLAMAIWGLSLTVPPVLGPLMGGWIAENLSWPWIFFINIPTGLFAAAMAWSLLRHRETSIVKRPIDGVGVALLVLWVGALQLMLDTGKDLDWFGSDEICVLATVAAVAFCFFIVWELTAEYPVVELRLFLSRNFAIGTISLSFFFGIFLGSLVLLPLWMQQFLGYTPTWAGIVLASSSICSVMMTPVVAKLLPKHDPRWFACVASLLFAAAFILRANFTLEATFQVIAASQIIQGAAVALFLIPMTTLSFTGLPQASIASAAGLSNAVRSTAGAIGISIMTTLWEDRASFHYARLGENITAYDNTAGQAIETLLAQGMPLKQILALLERQITAQAYMLSAIDVFMLSALLLALLAAAVWIGKPQSHATVPLPDVAP